eukprot:6209635-Pleurochrysis_carterae.AAC.4
MCAVEAAPTLIYSEIHQYRTNDTYTLSMTQLLLPFVCVTELRESSRTGWFIVPTPIWHSRNANTFVCNTSRHTTALACRASHYLQDFQKQTTCMRGCVLELADNLTVAETVVRGHVQFRSVAQRKGHLSEIAEMHKTATMAFGRIRSHGPPMSLKASVPRVAKQHNDCPAQISKTQTTKHDLFHCIAVLDTRRIGVGTCI